MVWVYNSAICLSSDHKPQGQGPVATPVTLVLLTKVLLLTLTLGGLGSDLLVILLEGGKVLAGLGELALLHALTDVPVHEGALGVPAGSRRPRRGEE